MKSLDRLFKPSSVAIIGGGAWSASVIKNLVKSGFTGEIWPVHPKKPQIEGQTTYSSLGDLPSEPDAAFVAVNRYATIEIIAELSKMGAGGAVCFASGFLESDAETQDGRELQENLIKVAGEMPIIGPNCYGFINYLDNVWVWPDQHGGQECENGVAILAQSSNIAINLTMQTRGLPIGFVGTVGNQAQTDLTDIGIHLLSDPRITALGLYIEGIKDIRAFEKLAQEADRLGKRIVALKVGRSAQAQAATLSHTASLAGSAAGSSALFKRLGIAEVTTLASLLECLKILHLIGPLKSNKILSASCSGGEASLIADMADPLDITFPELTDAQLSNLSNALGPKVKLANPLDYHTYVWGDTQAMGQTYAAAADPDYGLTLVVVDFPRSDLCDPSAWDCVIEALIFAKAETGLPFGLLASLPENLSEDLAKRMLDHGILPLCGMSAALEAIEAAATLTPVEPTPLTLPVEGLNPTLLTEAEAKAELAKFGVSIPLSTQAQTAEEAAQKATEIGFPVVLKGQGLAHKSEAGAVILSLNSASDVQTAFQKIDSPSVLVEQMVPETIAELLIGVVADPACGFVLTIGAGGVMTEILGDVQSLLVPASEQSIKEALLSLQIAPLLSGFRGKPAADTGSIVASILALQDYVIANANGLEEVEINPLIATRNTAIAADALIRKGTPK